MTSALPAGTRSLRAHYIGDNANAVTRFVLVSRSRAIPPRTGADKTSIIAELPDDAPGRLLEMLEQFAARGINLSRIESRPVGDKFGRYRFNIDESADSLTNSVSE